MAYKAKERIGQFDESVGAYVGGVATLLQMIERSLGETKTEADDWLSSLKDQENDIAYAMNSDYLNEIQPLLDEQLEKGDNYSDVLGNPEYSLRASSLSDAVQNKRTTINNFESTINRVAEQRLNKNNYFNPDIFYDTDGNMLDNKDWWEAFSNWHEGLNGAPIIWDLSYMGNYDNMAEFINFWQQLAVNPNSDPAIAKKYSPINIINQGYHTAQRDIDTLRRMGIEFNEEGDITNLDSLGNIEKDWKIKYSQQGKTSLEELSLEHIARQVWDNWRDYSNLSYAITQQVATPTLYNFEYNPGAGQLNRTPQSLPIQIVTGGEIMKALSVAPGSDGFEAVAKETIKNISQNITNSQRSLAGHLKFAFRIQEAIRKLKEGANLAELNELFANTPQEDKTYINNTLGAGGYDQLLSKLDDRAYLDSLMYEVTSKINNEQYNQNSARVKAMAWGAFDSVNMYDYSTLASQFDLLGAPKTQPKAYTAPLYLDKYTIDEWNSFDDAKRKQLTDEYNTNQLNTKTSLNEFTTEDDHELLQYIFANTNMDDPLTFASSPGRMYVKKNGVISEVQMIDYSNQEHLDILAENWDDPKKLIQAIKDIHNAEDAWFDNQDLLNYIDIDTYSNINNQLGDLITNYSQLWGNDAKQNMQNISKLKSVGKIEYENGVLKPTYFDDNKEYKVPTVKLLDNINIDAVSISSGKAKAGKSVENGLNLEKDAVLKIVFIENNEGYMPSRNLKTINENVPNNILFGYYGEDSDIFNDSYVSSLGENYNTDDLALLNYHEVSAPKKVIISNEQGELFQVNFEDIVNIVEGLNDTSVSTITNVMPSVDNPAGYDVGFDILKWETDGFKLKDFSTYFPNFYTGIAAKLKNK